MTALRVTLMVMLLVVLGALVSPPASANSTSDKWMKQLGKGGFNLTSSPDGLIGILGSPVLRKQNGNFEVIGYCRGGLFQSTFLYLYFEDEKFVYVTAHWEVVKDGPCSRRFTHIDWETAEREKQYPYEKEEFFIDGLVIEKLSLKGRFKAVCVTGNQHALKVSGEIGPDSTFAIERLLDSMTPCVPKDGGDTVGPIVTLASGGGLLEHGYLLGEILRERNITTRISDDKVCASSCAVAFLGGTKRIISDDGVILFHAPYTTGTNELGDIYPDCNVGAEVVNKLKSYYQKMTSVEVGARLFNRTMTYCSSKDGWVVKGGSAANLFGIATQAK
jgi:hypothetical protein